MTDTRITDQLRHAGVAVGRARLNCLVEHAWKRADGKIPTAMRYLEMAVREDREALLALIGDTTIRRRVEVTIRQKSDATKLSVGAASQSVFDSQGIADRLPTDPTPPRSVAPKKPAPASRISKVAARSVARSVFDERVMANFNKTYGEITQYDYLNLCVVSGVTSTLKKHLDKVRWRGLHVPLKDFADPAVIAAARDEVESVKQASSQAVKRRSLEQSS